MDVKLKERLVGALVIVALAVLVLPVVFDDDKGESALDSRIPDTPAGEPVRVITLSSPRPLDEIQPTAGQIAAGTRSEEVSAGKPVFEAVVPDAGVDGDLAAGDAEDTNPAPADALAGASAAHAPDAAGTSGSGASENATSQNSTSQNSTSRNAAPQSTASRNVASAPAAKPASSTVDAASAAAYDAAAKPASKASVPAASAKAPDQPASKPAATAPVPRLAEAVGGFVVQAGLFSSPEGAKRVEQQLRAAGLKAYLRREKQDGKALTRVLVGPLGSRAEADAVKAKMKAAQVDGMVAAYDPLKH